MGQYNVGYIDRDGDKLIAKFEALNATVLELWQGTKGRRVPFRIGSHPTGKQSYDILVDVRRGGEAVAEQVFKALLTF